MSPIELSWTAKKGLEAISAFNSLSQPLGFENQELVLQTEIYQDTSTGMILGCYCIKVPNQNVGTQEAYEDNL